MHPNDAGKAATHAEAVAANVGHAMSQGCPQRPNVRNGKPRQGMNIQDSGARRFDDSHLSFPAPNFNAMSVVQFAGHRPRRVIIGHVYVFRPHEVAFGIMKIEPVVGHPHPRVVTDPVYHKKRGRRRSDPIALSRRQPERPPWVESGPQVRQLIGAPTLQSPTSHAKTRPVRFWTAYQPIRVLPQISSLQRPCNPTM